MRTSKWSGKRNIWILFFGTLLLWLFYMSIYKIISRALWFFLFFFLSCLQWRARENPEDIPDVLKQTTLGCTTFNYIHTGICFSLFISIYSSKAKQNKTNDINRLTSSLFPVFPQAHSVRVGKIKPPSLTPVTFLFFPPCLQKNVGI